MKILAFGDIYGRVGRKGIIKKLPYFLKKYSPDFVLANIDNLTSGRGATKKHLLELQKAGVDIFTCGDHIFDRFKDIKDYIFSTESRALLFGNFYDKKLSKQGFRVFEKNGKKLLVVHLQAENYMPHKVENPFLCLENILLKDFGKLDGIIVDFHKELSSEVQAMAHFFDGKISFVFGTHTHIQTNDDMILKKGTGFLTDLGMNGPLYSIIGAKPESVKNRFFSGINRGKIEQELNSDCLISGVFVEIDQIGKCKNIEKIKEII